MKCESGWLVNCATWHPRCTEAELQRLLDVLTEEREVAFGVRAELDTVRSEAFRVVGRYLRERVLADELADALRGLNGGRTPKRCAAADRALARHQEARRD